MSESKSMKKTLVVVAVVHEGRLARYYAAESDSLGSPYQGSDQRTVYIPMKLVEIDCTPPEGWDWRPIAAAVYNKVIIEERASFAARVAELSACAMKCLAIGNSAEDAAPITTVETDDDIPF